MNASRGRAGRILVADDSLVVRAVLRDQLEDEGYDVFEADDGASALIQCAAVRPDAILLDVEMPGLDGNEVLLRLKNDANLADVPVVFLTGRTGTDDMVAGLRAGAHDYLKKPFETAELIARIGGAVRIKRLQDELRERNAELDRLSRIDALTGCYNRRHIDEQLAHLGGSARRRSQPMALLLFDIDHFKNINDTEGHLGGDLVLQQLVVLLQSTVRTEDVVGRWGGEEFLVVAPQTDLPAAVLLAERARLVVEQTPMNLGDHSIFITVSVGCAAGIDDAETLLQQADIALYRSKTEGRNRVSAETPARQG